MKEKILICDDDEKLVHQIAATLEMEGHETGKAHSGKQLLELIKTNHYPIIILDLGLPDADGLDLLEKIKPVENDLDVLVLSGRDQSRTVVQAMKRGAADFLSKNAPPQEFMQCLRKIQERRAERAWGQLQRLPPEREPALVGESKRFRRLLEDVRRFAESGAHILLRGESGTGKDRMAEYIRQHGRRPEHPLVKIHCPAYTYQRFQEELFGWESVASDGSRQTNKGRLEIAHGGTVLFDEIGVLSPRQQSILLQVVEDTTFTRMNGTRAIYSDVQFIFTTSRSLEDMVKSGQFNLDLYHRLNSGALFLPPLRERVEDIVPLAKHFLDLYNKKYGKNVAGFKGKAVAKLKSGEWPGNIRELASCVERAVIVRGEGNITEYDLPTAPAGDRGSALNETGDFEGKLSDYKMGLIKTAMEKTGGNKTRMAELLNVSRPYIYRLLERYNLEFFRERKKGKKKKEE